MRRERPLAAALEAAVGRQLTSLEALAARLPAGSELRRLEVPAGSPPLRSTAELLGHLLDACSGFAAALVGLDPKRFARLGELRSAAAGDPVDASAFRRELDRIRKALAGAFPELDDADLGRRVASVLVPGGQLGLELLLGNLEHVASHRQELFTRLRMAGVSIGTAELYGLEIGE